MIRQLLALQFALFYLPLLVISLGIYGFNSRESLALFYLLPIALYLVCRLRMPLCRRLLSGSGIGYGLVATGLGTALFLYQPLHMGTADERSSLQAVLMGILGCVSLLLSLRNTELPSEKGADRHFGLVLLCFAAAWTLSFYHQHIGIWLMAVFFALGLYQNADRKRDDIITANYSPAPQLPQKLLGYGIFLACMELSLIVWDLRENQHWALHLGLIMAAAAVAYMTANKSHKMAVPVLLAGLANFLVCCFFPSYVLNPLHSVIAGLSLGVLLLCRQQSAETPDANPNHAYQLTLATPVFLGFLVSYAIYANQQSLDYRVILLLPLLFLWLPPRRQVRSSA